MSARNEDFLFAQEAQNLGYVSEAQVEEAFLLQKRMAEELKIDERLAVILVKRGWMAEEQARRVYGLVEPEGRQTQIQGYRLVEKIGRGAMGTVYKAIHLGLHRVVAIKILRRELIADKTQVERLKGEAKLLASLDHPNIVRALDAGESNGFPYVVMEYVEGESLRDRIARQGPLAEDEALRITRALADALERARRMGVVHRDVKPGNVLMAKNGAPKLMDLGLAKGPIDLELTQHGATVGTPQFISPEQAEDPRKADSRSDIYSLGASLYAMVTGRPPFTGSTLAEILTKVLYEQPMPARVLNPDVSPEVSYLIERMMLKDPSLRYKSPAEVTRDIDEIVGGQSIIPAGFAGNWEAFLLRQRMRSLVRRGLVVGVAALVIGLGTHLFLQQRGRELGRQESAEVAAAAIEATAVDVDDDERSVAAKLERLDSALERVDAIQRDTGAGDENRRMLSNQRAYLAGLQKQLVAVQELEREAARMMEQNRFRAAIDQVRDFAPGGSVYMPVTAALSRLKTSIRQLSQAAWHAEVQRVQGSAAGDLASFRELWRGLREALSRNYVPQPELDKARREAAQLDEAAEEIHARVQAFRAEFSEAAIADAVASDALHDARQRLGAQQDLIRTFTGKRWRNNERWTPTAVLIGKGGHVTTELELVAKRADAQVAAHVDRLIERADAQVATQLVPEAMELLRTFVNDGGRHPRYAALLHRVEEALGQIQSDYEGLCLAAKGLVAETLQAVLRALRAGRPEAVRAAVARAEKQPASHICDEDLEELGRAEQVLKDLYTSAVAYLTTRTGRVLSPVRRGPQGEAVQETKWQLTGVDEQTQELTFLVPRRGGSPQPERFPIASFHLAQVAAWATSGNQAMHRESALLVQLAMLPLPDPTVRDLRPRVKAYRALYDEFLEDELNDVWSAFVRDAADELARAQQERERNAFRYRTQAESAYSKGRFVSALRFLDAYLDDRADSYYTDDVADAAHRERMLTLRQNCQAELKKRDLERWLPGFRAEELGGGRARLTADFDDPIQLDNFEHGRGRLEPSPGAVVTPDPHAVPKRLHLLKGDRGLVRDRPLVLRSMMDPHEEIVLEMDIDTLGGSILLAIDVDGAHVAFASADPNFYPAWRVPLTPKQADVADEKDLVDFYGRGRGVAFHGGRSFGDPSGSHWTWTDRQQGRFHERWASKTNLAGPLFAFRPGTRYRLKLVRILDTMTVFVDGREVAKHQDPDWRYCGGKSDRAPDMRRGSGRITILSWTPVAIDNLTLTGFVRESWRAEQKRLEVEAKKGAADGDAEEQR